MFVVMAFVMVGCGPTSTETISESFTAMYEKLDAQNEVFRKNDSALNTERFYNLTYGETVDGYIAEEGMPSLFTGSGAPQNQEDMGDYYFDSANLILYKKTDLNYAQIATGADNTLHIATDLPTEANSGDYFFDSDNNKIYQNTENGWILCAQVKENESTIYLDLQRYYNTVFSIAMSYIEENREIITRLNDDDLNDETKDLTTELNDKIKDFTTKIDDFMGAYSEFTNFFATYSGDGLSEGQLVQLRDFKRVYATFVNSSVELSLTLSSVVEATGILDNISSVGLIKNYICNKILNVYNAFYIVELGNFNWQGTTQTATKDELSNIITELQNSFSIYITIIQKPADELATLTTEQLTEIRAKTDNFMTEVDAYLKALDNLDIMTLAVNHNNDLDEYMEDNIYARADIDKISQFVNSTLPQYLEYLNQSFGI